MKKALLRFKLIPLVVALTILVSATLAFAGTKDETRVIVDTINRKVTIPKDVQTIAVVPIPWASVVYTIDGTADKLIGIHPSAKKSYSQSIFKSLAPKLSKADSKFVDNDFTIHMEEVAKLNPDVIIIWDYQTKEAEQLKSLGIPAVNLRYGSLEDLQDGIAVIGEVLGKQERATKLIKYHQDAQKYFATKNGKITKAKKPKVLYLRDQDLKVAAGGAVNTEFINLAGGVNVAKGIKGQWVNVTMEQIMAWNPDIIIMSNFAEFVPSDLYQNKLKGQDWSKIAAIKQKKVYKAPMGIYRWDAPCGESPLMIKWMGTKIQPTIFKDVNLTADLKKFYKTFYSYSLTQKEIDQILQKNLNK